MFVDETRKVEVLNVDDLNINDLPSLVRVLQDALDKIPEDKYDTIRVDITQDFDDDVEIVVSYKKPLEKKSWKHHLNSTVFDVKQEREKI